MFACYACVHLPYACRVHAFDRVELLTVPDLGPVNLRVVISRHIQRCNLALVCARAFKLSGMIDISV